MELASSALFDFPPFRVDANRRTLVRDGLTIAVPRKAFDTLVVLLEHRGEVVPKGDLLKRVWRDSFVEENSLNQSISALRKALGDSAGVSRYIDTVAGLGYRFVAPIAAVPEPEVVRPRKLAVLPLRTLGGGEGEWLGIGIADTLITRLSNVRELTVRPTSSVLRYAAQECTPSEAGRALDVDAVLEGNIRRAGERVRVTVQLVSVGNGAPIWAGTFDEQFTEIFDVEDSISQRVAEALTTRLSGEERSMLTRHATENSEVYRLYLNGRWYSNRLTREGSAKAIECLRQAVELDPSYALGHAGLAYHYYQQADGTIPSLEAMTRAEEAAQTALSLDPSLVDARVTLAAVRFFRDWDAKAAIDEFERALSLDRRSAYAHRLYGFSLVFMGRFDAGLAALRVAEELDPKSLENAMFVAPAHYWARQYEEAARVIRGAIERDPEFWLAQVILGRIHEVQGDFESAIALYERAHAIDDSSPESLGDLGRALARAGKKARARKVLAELQERARNEHVPAFTFVGVYDALGDRDLAFAALQAAIDERSWFVTWLKVDPLLDPLRDDPRFEKLVQM
jgi:TolB-like protein/Tfp pilus assembly protein PilF